MTEVTYTAGYNIMANLGKGKAVLGLHLTSVADGYTITTPFMRCVPTMTAAVGAGATDVTNVTESDGVVTISSTVGCPSAVHAIIMGDLY